MNYKTIIFDLDGTLLYTIEDLANSVNYALEDGGYPLRTLNEIRSFVGNGVKTLMTRSVPAGTTEKEIEERLSVFRPHYLAHMYDTTVLYDGIIELLSSLKDQGYQLAIVSNKLDTAVKELNARFFSQYIDIAIGTPPDAKKPNPHCISLIIKLLNARQSSTIYVGDSEVDIETAHNAGISCVGVSWGFRDRLFLVQHHSDYIIDQPMELLHLLNHMK